MVGSAGWFGFLGCLPGMMSSERVYCVERGETGETGETEEREAAGDNRLRHRGCTMDTAPAERRTRKERTMFYESLESLHIHHWNRCLEVVCVVCGLWFVVCGRF